MVVAATEASSSEDAETATEEVRRREKGERDSLFVREALPTPTTAIGCLLVVIEFTGLLAAIARAEVVK